MLRTFFAGFWGYVWSSPTGPGGHWNGLTSRNGLSHQTCSWGARLASPGALEQIVTWELGKLGLNPSSALYWLCDRQVILHLRGYCLLYL